jgi:hypothetical protein
MQPLARVNREPTCMSGYRVGVLIAHQVNPRFLETVRSGKAVCLSEQLTECVMFRVDKLTEGTTYVLSEISGVPNWNPIA